jgi:hypothetical protein
VVEVKKKMTKAISMRLTVDDVAARIVTLSAMARSKDYESADAEEHQIWEDVLEAIREGHPHAKAMADQALRTKALEFPRGWGS